MNFENGTYAVLFCCMNSPQGTAQPSAIMSVSFPNSKAVMLM